MLDIIIRGGPVMIPLLFCSVLALAVSLERLAYLLWVRIDTDDLMDDVKLSINQGKMLEAMQYAKRARGPVAALVAAGIAYYDQDKEDLKEHLRRVGEQEIYKLERRMPVLEAIVGIAPLLGLLGTVLGIIKSFRVLAALQGISQPSALSIGVAEALITTAAGLMIAIPAMALYYLLNSIIDHHIADMNKRSTQLIKLLENRGGE